MNLSPVSSDLSVASTIQFWTANFAVGTIAVSDHMYYDCIYIVYQDNRILMCPGGFAHE